MNDNEIEIWLAERFRVAPTPEPRERLRQAIRADRVRASVSRGSTEPGLSLRLTGRGKVFAGFVGLAATVILAAGLFAVVASRSTQSAAAPGAIQWQSIITGPGVTFTFGPYLASTGGRLYMVGSIGLADGAYATEVWASSDATTWQRVSEPGAFETNGSGFFAQAFSSDGQGGLIVVGGLVSQPETTTSVAWHSSDGRTWTRAQVGGPAVARMAAVAARPGAIVALGEWMVPVANSATASGQTADQLYAWFSADGTTWSEVILPDSLGYSPSAITAWKGGFVAIAQKEYGDSVLAVWTSNDGRTWEKAPTDLVGFGASTMVALADRIVAVGSIRDSKLGMVPASWSSTDGRAWVESTASTRDPAIMFDDVTVVRHTLVAIGSSHTGGSLLIAGRPESPQPPLPPESIWTSSDGTTWSLLAENSALKFGDYLDTHIASLENRVVVATQGAGAVEIFLGDLAT